MFYALRYAADVPYDRRPHEPTLGRFETFGEALDAAESGPQARQLEVVLRDGEGGGSR